MKSLLLKVGTPSQMHSIQHISKQCLTNRSNIPKYLNLCQLKTNPKTSHKQQLIKYCQKTNFSNDGSNDQNSNTQKNENNSTDAEESEYIEAPTLPCFLQKFHTILWCFFFCVCCLFLINPTHAKEI